MIETLVKATDGMREEVKRRGHEPDDDSAAHMTGLRVHEHTAEDSAAADREPHAEQMQEGFLSRDTPKAGEAVREARREHEQEEDREEREDRERAPHDHFATDLPRVDA